MAEIYRKKPVRRAFLDGVLIFEYYAPRHPKNFGEFVITWEVNQKFTDTHVLRRDKNNMKAVLEYNDKKYIGTAWLGYNEEIESLYFLTGKVMVFNG